MPWRKKWQPTPLFLPGESHRQRSLAGPSLWGCKELDTTLNWALTHTQNVNKSYNSGVYIFPPSNPNTSFKKLLFTRTGDCCWPMKRILSSLLILVHVWVQLNTFLCLGWASANDPGWCICHFQSCLLLANGTFVLEFTAVVDHRVFCFLQCFCFSA